MEHAFAEQIEAGTSVHLPLQELESVDLTLDHAVAPPQSQGGQNCVFIETEMPDEGSERRSAPHLRSTRTKHWALRMRSRRKSHFATRAMNASSGEDSQSAARYLL